MLSVSNRVPDNILKEDFKHATSFLVDEATDSLHATPSSKATDSRLGDALDVITEDLAMPLGAAFTKTFASFATARHGWRWVLALRVCSESL